MGRLIDTDKLIEAMKEFEKVCEEENTYPSWENAYNIIDNQPTSFDKDKVVEELENKIEMTWEHDYLGGKKDAFKEAIEIVRKGGI